MFKLVRIRHYLWRNAIAPSPVMAGVVTLADAFNWTTSVLPDPLLSALKEGLPGAIDETQAQDAAELIAAIALRFQLEGDVAAPFCGVSSRDPQAQTATLFFSCMDPYLGQYTATKAVQIVGALTGSELAPETLVAALKSCIENAEKLALHVSNRHLIQAAERKGIPWVRTFGVSPYATLGQGFRQHHLIYTVLGIESAIGRDFANNKLLHLKLLSEICLPVGKVVEITSHEQALRAAENVGYPLVLKPSRGGSGSFVFANLRSSQELDRALLNVPLEHQQFLLQSFFPGDDHRLLVVNGKLVAAAARIPASVIGDGVHTIVDLVEVENRNIKRVRGPMKYISLDTEADRVLAQQGYTRDSVPMAGTRAYTRATANIATGGSGVDVTELVHPDNARAAVRTAKALQLTVAGVDFICPDISRSWHEAGGGICEVNSQVGLRVHNLANPDHDVAGIILEAVYPAGDDGRIPTAMVTGAMGKTTTCNMLNSILSCCGHVVGMATTDGVTIGSETMLPGDMGGPKGHAVALRDPTVTAAVLETAGRSLLGKGMYLDQCDVAALTNVDHDHIGLSGIKTLDDMAGLNRKVLDGARKAVILNADDPRCLAMAADFTPRIRTILFSRDAKSAAIKEHLLLGYEAVFLGNEDGQETIIAVNGSQATPVVKTVDLPSTAGGISWPQSCNAMVATAMAIGLGIDQQKIIEGLIRYGRDGAA